MTSPTTGYPAAVAGGTGLVGRYILDILLQHPQTTSIAAFTRRPLSPPDPHSRLRPIQTADSTSWPTEFPSIHPTPAVFFSALGTTRAQAGSFAKQYEIDHDLNLALAKAAKKAGVRVYVLVSSGGASKGSIFPYTRMKGELEEAVKEIGFEKTVIMRPGLLVGERKDDRRLAEYVLQCVAAGMGAVSGGLLKDFWAQDADVIGAAAVEAGLRCLDGRAPSGKVWMVSQKDILQLGKAGE